MLIREGTDYHTSGRIYGTVVQVVMLYGLDIRVTTTHIGRVLGGFHHIVACRLTGR